MKLNERFVFKAYRILCKGKEYGVDLLSTLPSNRPKGIVPDKVVIEYSERLRLLIIRLTEMGKLEESIEISGKINTLLKQWRSGSIPN